MIREEPLDFALGAVVDDVYKAWLAEFDEQLELVTRFERDVLFDRHLLGDIPLGHKSLKGPCLRLAPVRRPYLTTRT
jgi:hypothetical protein